MSARARLPPLLGPRAAAAAAASAARFLLRAALSRHALAPEAADDNNKHRRRRRRLRQDSPSPRCPARPCPPCLAGPAPPSPPASPPPLPPCRGAVTAEEVRCPREAAGPGRAGRGGRAAAAAATAAAGCAALAGNPRVSAAGEGAGSLRRRLAPRLGRSQLGEGGWAASGRRGGGPSSGRGAAAVGRATRSWEAGVGRTVVPRPAPVPGWRGDPRAAGGGGKGGAAAPRWQVAGQRRAGRGARSLPPSLPGAPLPGRGIGGEVTTRNDSARLRLRARGRQRSAERRAEALCLQTLCCLSLGCLLLSAPEEAYLVCRAFLSVPRYCFLVDFSGRVVDPCWHFFLSTPKVLADTDPEVEMLI